MRPDQLEAHPGAHYRMLPNPGGRDITARGYHRQFPGGPTLAIPPAPPEIPWGISHTPYSSQTTSNDFPSPAQNRKDHETNETNKPCGRPASPKKPGKQDVIRKEGEIRVGWFVVPED